MEPQQCKWVKPGETITIQGINISRGNFYLGTKLNLQFRDYSHPDKLLNVTTSVPCIDGSLTISTIRKKDGVPFDSFYFDSFYGMTPYMRYLYLSWLASTISLQQLLSKKCGRSLFQYYLLGCGIRLFFDQTTTEKEKQDIVTELLNIRKQNSVLTDQTPPTTQDCALNEALFTLDRRFFELDRIVYYSLFRLDSTFVEDIVFATFSIVDPDKGQIPDKYSSYTKMLFLKHYYTHLNDSCYWDDFSSTFELYGSDLFEFHDNRFKFKIQCKNIRTAIRNTRWSLSHEFQEYNQLVSECRDENNLYVLFSIPKEIDITSEPAIIDFVRSDIFPTASEITKVSVRKLLDITRCPQQDGTILHKRFIRLLLSGFRQLGYSIVPNCDIDEKRFDFKDNIYIYKSIDPHDISLKQTDLINRITILLSAILYQCRYHSEITNSDYSKVDTWISSVGLPAELSQYVKLSFRWSAERIKNKAVQLRADVKNNFNELCKQVDGTLTSALKLMVELIHTNGYTNENRKQNLEKVLASVYNQSLRQLMKQRLADVQTPSKLISSSLHIRDIDYEENKKVVIDPIHLTEIEHQTNESQQILTSIFTDNAEEIETEQPSSPKKSSVEYEILSILLSKEEWTKEEFVQLCKHYNAIPGALMERINDISYEKVNDAVIEDDGEIINVTLEYKNELL